MNLIRRSSKGIDVAFLLQISSKNASADFGFFRPHFHAKTQLIDALMAFEHHLDLFQGVIDGLRQKLQCLQDFKGLDFCC